MKRQILAAVLTMGLLAFSGQIVAGPQLTIDNGSFDFGLVPQNSKVSHVYWLHSTGDDTLKITQVVPGCGCTKAPLERDRLAPGDSTRLEVIFDTRNYSGLITKAPHIETNEGQNAQVVQFTCKVSLNPDSTHPILIRPHKLDFIQIDGKPRKEFQFTISNVSDKEIDLTTVDYPEQYATIEIPKSIKAGETAQAKVKFNVDAADKEIEKSLTLQLNDGEKSRFTVPLKRTIIKPSVDTTATPAAGRK